MSTQRIITMVAVGAVVGAGIGMLYTDKGQKAVSGIKEGSSEYGEKLKEGLVTLLFGIIDKLTTVKEKAEEVKSEVKEEMVGTA